MSTRAGLPAEASDLIDVDELINAYYDRVPDPSVPEQRVAFGTSGHRGSSLSSSFNETHILATTQAIVDYRKAQGIEGPLFLGRDTHGLSLPAERSAIEVLVANGIDVRDRRARLVGADARAQPRDPRVQQGPGCRRPGPRGRHRRDPIAQSAARRRVQVQPAERRTGRHRRDGLDRRPRQRAHRGEARGRRAHPVQGPRRRCARPVRLPRRVCPRPLEHHRHRRDPKRRRAHRRRPAGRRVGGVLAADRRRPRSRPHGREPRRRPDLALHDPRLGREDPDGSVVAVGHGVAGRSGATSTTSSPATTRTPTATAS